MNVVSLSFEISYCTLLTFSPKGKPLWLLFGISKVPASLLVCLEAILSKVRVSWTQDREWLQHGNTGQGDDSHLRPDRAGHARFYHATYSKRHLLLNWWNFPEIIFWNFLKFFSKYFWTVINGNADSEITAKGWLRWVFICDTV